MPTGIVDFSKWISKNIGTWAVFIADHFIMPKGQELFCIDNRKRVIFPVYVYPRPIVQYVKLKSLYCLRNKAFINKLLNVIIFIHKGIFTVFFNECKLCQLKSSCTFELSILVFLCTLKTIQDDITNFSGYLLDKEKNTLLSVYLTDEMMCWFKAHRHGRIGFHAEMIIQRFYLSVFCFLNKMKIDE